MVSELQLHANRANGSLGGPKTEARKAISSRNATKHGLLSKQVLLPGENTGEFKALWTDLMAHYEPQDATETLLLDIVVASIWRWRRVLMIESDVFDYDWSENKWYPVQNIDSMQNVMRYESALERRMYKALNELERVQDIRKGKNVPPRLSIDVDMDHH